MSRKKRVKKIAVILASVFLIVFACLVLFIKLDTQAAAEFTDNYLRPVFGNKNVIFLEKIFYNASDKIDQFTSQGGKSPSYTENDQVAPVGGDLNVNPIPVNPKLTPLKGEGIWLWKKVKIFPNQDVLAYTFVRPDPSRPYANVELIQADMGPLMLGDVAGTKQPGGPAGNIGPGIIPSNIVKNGLLVAAFNGGFQYRDGEYGMIVGNKTYLPLKNNLGTLVGYTNGSIKIVNYTGQDLGTNIAFIRQNCPILIESDELSVANPQNHALWGRTDTTDIYTWRSGVGITKEGNLLYAVGNNINPTTLAIALKMGGAINAIQLDINPFWVRFSIFDYQGNGNYSSTALMKGVYNGAKQFLGGYQKDFFYIYKKD